MKDILGSVDQAIGWTKIASLSRIINYYGLKYLSAELYP